MTFKSIKIKEATFNRLKKNKLKNQSFSRLIDNGLFCLTQGNIPLHDNNKSTIPIIHNFYFGDVYLVKDDD